MAKKNSRNHGVEVAESKGKIIIARGYELAFLEVLDRGRYEVSLVKEEPEEYRAGSRKRISG